MKKTVIICIVFTKLETLSLPHTTDKTCVCVHNTHTHNACMDMHACTYTVIGNLKYRDKINIDYGT